MRPQPFILDDLCRDDRGSALIEMAVVVPVLFTIGFGVIEFGNAIYSYHLIANGVRDAARYASGLEHDPGANDGNIKCIAMTGLVSGGACNPAAAASCTSACRVSWWNDAATETTVSYDEFDNVDGSGNRIFRGQETIWRVTVTANVSYESIGFLGYLGLSAPTLSVSHEERIIGVR